MLGIGVFGYMIGTIQTLFIGFQAKDQTAELEEMINLWLISLDKMMPELLSKKVFKDVRDFYVKKQKIETQLVLKNQFFNKLKPRLQTIIIDAVYKLKYEHFKNIFEGCSTGFQREIITQGKMRYYSAKQEEDMNVNDMNEIVMPVIDDAFQHSRHIYLILYGTVNIMDQSGMYDYGVIKAGSYFGDISILLNQPNNYAYFYNPHQENALQLLRIKRSDFLDIC